MAKTPRNVWRCISSLLPVLLLACPGCSDDKNDFEVISLEGKVEKITISASQTGEISVRYYSEKHKQEIVGKGQITKETEIQINGVVARLEDIREGDQIRGEVRVEKKGGTKKQIALKIFVDRPKPVGGGGG